MTILRRLDHVSIGVHDHAKAEHLFLDILGGERIADEGVCEPECFRWSTFRLGGKKIELVSSLSRGEGGVGRYLEKYGEGMHHLSFGVDSLDAAIDFFISHGIRVLLENRAAEKFKHCYLHPMDTCGVLIQVFEENDDTRSKA